MSHNPQTAPAPIVLDGDGLTLVSLKLDGQVMRPDGYNVGMNLGLMPVTGITLPLISYGGSSVLGTFLALGVLQAVHAQSRAQSFRSS